jgi:hypothetical protein
MLFLEELLESGQFLFGDVAEVIALDEFAAAQT